MHDIDRAMFEMEQQEAHGESYESLGAGETFETFETPGALQAPGAFESAEAFGEFEAEAEAQAQEAELAAGLLEVSSEAELEQFLGGLIRSAASAARGFAGSATGQALGGVLRQAARQALPQVGRVLGDAVMPGAGGQLGQRAGQWLGGQFELEGLSAEDREFEVARALVRVGQDATRAAVAAGPGQPPEQAALAATVAAAQRHLPGLVPLIGRGQAGTPPSAGRRRPVSGRWVRQGNRIVLFGI